ncbi:MAG: phage integrase SAM-like domain-containing protein, partial [Eubacterium sp.]|nr:phage integrase SAM-like domain-containing protein [Eubacterium sp.]
MVDFINYLERVENVGRKKISFHNFEKETIKRYQTWMIMEQGLAPKTCNLRLTAIRAFLEYAAQEYLWIMPVYTDALFTYNIYYFTIIQLRWLLIGG